MWHGPRYQTLAGVQVDAGGGWAWLRVPETDVVEAPSGLPVSVLDGLFQACGLIGRLSAGVVALPAGFASLELYEAPEPGSSCVARLDLATTDDGLSADITACRSDGRVWLRIEGYRSRRLPQ